MEAAIPEHPDRARLAAFGRGALESEEMDALEGHLAVCDSCCELVSTLPDDEFVDRLRASQRSPHPALAFFGDATVATTAQGDWESSGREAHASCVMSDASRSFKMPPLTGASARSRRELPLELEIPTELLNHS